MILRDNIHLGHCYQSTGAAVDIIWFCDNISDPHYVGHRLRDGLDTKYSEESQDEAEEGLTDQDQA